MDNHKAAESDDSAARSATSEVLSSEACELNCDMGLARLLRSKTPGLMADAAVPSESLISLPRDVDGAVQQLIGKIKLTK